MSGFLITGILLDTMGASNFFRAFYARRSLRIFPLYYLIVLVAFFAVPHLPKIDVLQFSVPGPASFPFYLTYTINWWLPFVRGEGGLIGLFWTLAVEEQFYVVWPALVFLCRPKWFPWICLGCCVAALIFRIPFSLRDPGGLAAFMTTLARMDSLIWGALGAYAVRTPALWTRLRPLLPWVGGLALCILLYIDFLMHDFYRRGFPTQTVGYSVIAIGFTAFILMIYESDGQQGRLARLFQIAPLVAFGRYSYGIYVLHPFVHHVTETLLGKQAWFGHSLWRALLSYVAYMTACFLIAMASYHLYEKHFLRLKRHFVAKTPRTAPETVA